MGLKFGNIGGIWGAIASDNLLSAGHLCYRNRKNPDAEIGRGPGMLLAAGAVMLVEVGD